jgi:hypothetical protein
LWTPTFSHLTVHSSPQVTLVHLAANTVPLGLHISGQVPPQLLVDLGNYLIVSLLGFLEHLLSLLNLHLAGLNLNICQDSVHGPTSGFEEILHCLGLPYGSLSKLPTLCVQPLLLDDAEDCNNVHKVFLGVPMGVNGLIDVGIVGKLDLHHLRFFLRGDDVRLRYVQDGQPVAQLPFPAVRIFQHVGRLEGSTYFGVLSESGTELELIERRLWRDS